MDDPATVHELNVLTVVANESYKDFVAETKGSMSTMELRNIEEVKIACARKFFDRIATEQVKYEVVKDFETLLQIVRVS